MAAPRKFDWEEAARLREGGRSYARIGKLLGVSAQAVRLALNDDARADDRARVKAWSSDSVCPDCGAPSTRLKIGGERRCVNCRDKLQATSVRPDSLKCGCCDEWKPDDSFPFNRGGRKLRRGRHGQCRICLTKQKRRWRALNPDKDKAANRLSWQKRRAKTKGAAR